MMQETINILFAGTSDYIPYAVVTAVSAKIKLNPNYKLKMYYLYADIVKDITDKERQNIFEYARATFEEHNIEFEFIDISDKVHLLDGQNLGMWGEKVSLTHYFYMLSPLVLQDINKIIYLDSDIIINCDLSEVYNMDLGNHLIAMGAPRGMEEMGDDVCNAGVVFFNLDLWRKENTLPELLEFGRKLPKSKYCAQNLLHQYFTLNHNDRLLLIDKSYNIFPQLFPDMDIKNIKILHYTGWGYINPCFDINGQQRAGYLWWKYARMTTFYETFLMKNIKKQITNKMKYKPLERIFSIKKFEGEKYLMILGIKIKLKRK